MTELYSIRGWGIVGTAVGQGKEENINGFLALDFHSNDLNFSHFAYTKMAWETVVKSTKSCENVIRAAQRHTVKYKLFHTVLTTFKVNEELRRLFFVSIDLNFQNVPHSSP